MSEYGYLAYPTIENGVWSRRKESPPNPNPNPNPAILYAHYAEMAVSTNGHPPAVSNRLGLGLGSGLGLANPNPNPNPKTLTFTLTLTLTLTLTITQP